MKPQYFDIHSHISFSEFDKDRKTVIVCMRDEDVWTITVGVDYKSSKKAAEMAEKLDGFFATIGQHPSDNRKEKFILNKYKKLIIHPKVVAVGECGLEYFRMPKHTPEDDEKKRQKELFKVHIQLALDSNKPLMLHCRPSQNSMDAYEDVLDILRFYYKIYGRKLHGNVHFFVGTKEIAKRFLEIGFTFSFTGVITFTNNYDEVIRFLPLDMIMSETDCPFVAPVPYRGGRNEPTYVVEVVKKIAEIRGEDFEKVRAQLVENALRVFDIA